MKTPQLPAPALAAALGLPNELWLKREDKHHYGSHKGRSIPLMIDEYVKQGKTNFVISSSGNAALAAIRAVLSHNKNKPQNQITLQVFIGKEINEAKKTALIAEASQNSNITLTQIDNPKQQALQFEKEHGAQLLRQSTDPLALIGYAELADELARIPGLSAVFIPTSSGTAAEGLHKGFKAKGLNPEIHIVQTASCHPIADNFYAATKITPPHLPDEKSKADAIVDVVGRRKESVVQALEESRGGAWIATNAEIDKAIAIARDKAQTVISPTSTLALVGLEQAVATGKKWAGPVACIITGS